MSKHTPTPWYAGRMDAVSYHAEDVESGPYKNIYVNDPNGKMHLGDRLPAVVCEVFGALGADCRTNAAYIVRAVNSHEALLAALKGMVALWDRVHPGNPPLGMLTVNSARAAIALAESHDA
jgi:hypothetical protein